MKDYTIGNWTVSDLITDTVVAPKTISVPDLSYAHDFNVQDDGPDEAKLGNITGPDVMPHETIRYAKSGVGNVYQGNELVDPGSMAPVKRGVQVMAELVTVYRTINKVTGLEYDLPCKGRIVLRVPSMPCVTDALVRDLLERTISASFNTGKSDSARIVEMARGALVPSGSK